MAFAHFGMPHVEFPPIGARESTPAVFETALARDNAYSNEMRQFADDAIHHFQYGGNGQAGIHDYITRSAGDPTDEHVRRMHITERFNQLLQYRRYLSDTADRFTALLEHPTNGNANLRDLNDNRHFSIFGEQNIRSIRRAVKVIDHELETHESLIKTIAKDAAKDNIGSEIDRAAIQKVSSDVSQAIAQSGTHQQSWVHSVLGLDAAAKTTVVDPAVPLTENPARPLAEVHTDLPNATHPPTGYAGRAPTTPGPAIPPWMLWTGGSIAAALIALSITAVAFSVTAGKQRKAEKARQQAQLQAPGRGAPPPGMALAGAAPVYANGAPQQYVVMPAAAGYGAPYPPGAAQANAAPIPGLYNQAFAGPRYGLVPPAYGFGG